MVWWWLGNAVLLLVIAPLLVLLLHRLLVPIREIRAYIDDTREHEAGAIAALEATDELTETGELAERVGAGVRRYGAAIDQLLAK